MSAVTVKPVSGIGRYEIREDDGPPVEVFHFDAAVEIGDDTYPCDFDSYDFSCMEWIADCFPQMEYDEQKELARELYKAFQWVIDERGRW